QLLSTHSDGGLIQTLLPNHTFMRDDGYRYDPVATDAVWAESISFLSRVLA
ncbi:MAG: dienelactone hydrolase family protein, partial [Cyanobacteria bacterium J06560_2]